MISRYGPSKMPQALKPSPFGGFVKFSAHQMEVMRLQGQIDTLKEMLTAEASRSDRFSADVRALLRAISPEAST